jgi:hypothetical protein
MGISLPRGPIWEPGRDLLAGTFEKKRIVYPGSFLGPRGTLVKGQGSPELILDYGA